MKSLRIVASAKGCDLADGLLNGGEVGLLHLRAISHVVGRTIRVWDSAGKILGIFGDQCNNKYVDQCERYSLDLKRNVLEKLYGNVQIEENCFSKGCFDLRHNCLYMPRDGNNSNQNLFLELQYLCSDNGRIGHWVTKDVENCSERKEGSLRKGNNCLFVAICQQCQDYEPETLRMLTAEFIRHEVLVMEDIFTQFQGVGILLLGGAKYDGRSSNDSKQIIDASQGVAGYMHAAKAHPRGHASHPRASGNLDCVENYSRDTGKDFPKSAWMSRDEQDQSMHRLLLTNQVQDGIARLNRGETRIVIKMNPDFEIIMGLWAGGEMFRGPLRAEFVTILLQHHNGMQNDISADVQVFTCYPMAPKGSENASMSIPRNLSLKRSSSTAEDNEETNKKSKLDLS